MDFSLGLHQSQSLQQRMQLTAQMIHGLDLLQLPIQELAAQIDKELVENPVLEIAGTVSVEKPEDQFESEKIAKQKELENGFNKLEQLDSPFDEDQAPNIGAKSQDSYSKMDAMENTAEQKGSLIDHLMEQLSFLDISQREKDLVEHLFYRLNEDGFFTEKFEELIKNDLIEATEEEWRNAVEIIQRLEPNGIGVFSREESLLLQLKKLNMSFPLLETLIQNHFQDVLHNRLPKVCRDMNISMDELRNLVKSLKHLNPKPGAAYALNVSNNIKPDVIIEEVEGELVIKISNAGLPSLGISQYYMEMMDQSVDSQSKKYIKEKMSSAQKIIDSLHKRKETLYKISTELIRTQKDFFREGVSGLKPLMMQEVADRVKMHVSTVCRTVANKYVQSPMGTYPLKYFFVNSSGSDDGNTTTQEVLQKIKNMIDTEDKKHPHSDQAIVEFLKKDNLTLARRTVTKYREQLGIPSSIKRKDH